MRLTLMSALRQYRFADWVPEGIRDWFRALNSGRTGPAGHLVVVAKILQAGNRYGLQRHGRAFVKEFAKRHIDFLPRLESFLEEVARLRDLPAELSLTPAKAKQAMSHASRTARELKTMIQRHPRLFLGHDSLCDELTTFVANVERRRAANSSDGVYPEIGRNDGSNAVRNVQVRNIAVAAVFHLGDLFPSFTAAVASTVVDSMVSESTLRSIAPGLQRTHRQEVT